MTPPPTPKPSPCTCNSDSRCTACQRDAGQDERLARRLFAEDMASPTMSARTAYYGERMLAAVDREDKVAWRDQFFAALGRDGRVEHARDAAFRKREAAIEEAGGVGNWLADERERSENYSWDVGSSQI